MGSIGTDWPDIAPGTRPRRRGRRRRRVRIEPAVAKLAEEWPAWGHRKIWAMGRYEGWELGSQSSVRRAMARRGLLQPVRYQAERRQLAKAPRAVFVDVSSRRNRVWQADFL